MSLSEFLQRIDRTDLPKNEKQWFPKWLAGYASHHQLNDVEPIPLESDLVLSFLRSFRDTRHPAWRRLQAAHALEH